MGQPERPATGVPDLPRTERGRPETRPTRIDYVKIATELRDPERVLERIRMASRRPAPPVSAPPRTPLERDLAELWAELLNLQAVGIHDNFFDLGGHSLLATQVISRLRAAFNVNLPLRSLFEAPTVASLATHVETMCWASQSPPPKADSGGGSREEAVLVEESI